MLAPGDGIAPSVRLYLDSRPARRARSCSRSTAKGRGGSPDALLATGTLDTPLAGGWNAVALETGVPLVAGQPYWIGLLNPVGSAGTLRWRDRAGERRHGRAGEPEHDAQRAPGQLGVERELVGRAAVRVRVGHRRRARTDAHGHARPRRPSRPRRRRRCRACSPTRPPSRRPPATGRAWGFDERSGTTAKDARAQPRLRSAAGGGTLRRRARLRRPRRLGDAARPKLTGAMTVEAWVRPTRRSGAVAAQELSRSLAWGLYPAAASVAGARHAARSGSTAGRISPSPTTEPRSGATSQRPRDGAVRGPAGCAGATRLRNGSAAGSTSCALRPALSAARSAPSGRTPSTRGPADRRGERPEGRREVKRYRGT